METGVHFGSGDHILGIQTIILSVLRYQVYVDRVTVVHYGSIFIDYRRYRVLGIQLFEQDKSYSFLFVCYGFICYSVTRINQLTLRTLQQYLKILRLILGKQVDHLAFQINPECIDAHLHRTARLA